MESRGAYRKKMANDRVSSSSILKTGFVLQNNHVEAVPKEKYGIFYDDCTYIIYAATIKGCIVNQYTIVSHNRFAHLTAFE